MRFNLAQTLLLSGALMVLSAPFAFAKDARLKNTGSVAAIEEMVERIFASATGPATFSSPFEFALTTAD